MTETLGRSNPLLRRLRSLRRDPARRREEDVLLAEGVHLAQEALSSAAHIELAVVSSRLGRSAEGRDLLGRMVERGVPCHETADDLLEKLQDARSAQPVLTLVRRPRWPDDAGLAPTDAPALVAVACGVQDPGNLGGLARTAHAAGATAFAVCGDGADPYHPRAVRATMGAVFRLPWITLAPAALLDQLSGRGIRSVAAGPRRGTTPDASDLTSPVALWFGGEGGGLPTGIAERIDDRVWVPTRAGVESLSVGAAAAVLLFEAARQRGAWSDGERER